MFYIVKEIKDHNDRDLKQCSHIQRHNGPKSEWVIYLGFSSHGKIFLGSVGLVGCTGNFFFFLANETFGILMRSGTKIDHNV